MKAAVAQRRVTRFTAALAALLLATAFAVVDAGPANAAGARSISGHVVLPAGAPDTYFDNLYVTAYGDTLFDSGYSTVALDGSFSIGNLAPDTYTVKVVVDDDVIDSEYVPIPVAEQYYPSSFNESGATHLNLNAEDTIGLSMQLTAAGIVSGHVALGPGFNPNWIQAVYVKVTGTNGVDLSSDMLTLSGDYSVSNIPVGTYTVRYIVLGYQEGPDWISTTLKNQYFEDAWLSSDATPVTVTADSTTTGIDATMSDKAGFDVVGTPVITYLKLTAGSTLGSSTGSWTPGPDFEWQWRRNGVAIPGATNPQYVLTTTDRGTNITVTVTGTLAGYSTTSNTSAAKYIPRVFTSTPTPTITGTLKSGYTLTAHRGTWVPTPTTVTYQWYRNSVKIPGATKYTYKLTAADKGTHIKVTVTGKRAGYTNVAKTSAYKTIAR